MRVRALDPHHPSALRRSLVRYGVDPVRADAMVSGTRTTCLFVSDIDDRQREALLLEARGIGVECLTGDHWALLLGTVARLAGLIRPGHSDLPSDLGEAIGVSLRGLTVPRSDWQTAGGSIPLDRPVVGGIINVTPDSFSDGGQFLEPGAAARRAVELVEEGADFLDLGAESTRPGRTSDAISDDEEWARLGPALAAVISAVPSVPVSVDTYRSQTARKAIEAGATIINDVSGFRFDDELPAVCAEMRAGVILMHSRGTLAEVAGYAHADYDDLVADVSVEIGEAVGRALDTGISREAVIVDPGLGFGKRPDQNFEILSRLSDFAALGFPVMVGPSRKRFVRESIGDSGTDALDEATGTICAAAWLGGATLFRVHRADVARRALDLASTIRET